MKNTSTLNFDQRWVYFTPVVSLLEEAEILDKEKRRHPRFSPQDMIASIVIKQASDNLTMQGRVLDLSYRGIKVLLSEPLDINIDGAEVRISLILPESNLPVSIHGKIKHALDQHIGVHFAESHSENIVDSMMFECIKSSLHSVQL